MMKTAPDDDEAMRILSRIIQDYTWAEFKPILYSPETLKRWLAEQQQPTSERTCHPDDPIVGELVTIAAHQEDKALEFLGELDPAERDMLTAAWVDVWGKG